VDYNNNGMMERLPVTSATASAGTVTKISGNNKGVWVAGNAWTNGSFSATVKLLTAIKDVAGACAYASNYPPVGKYTSATNISFTGTPDYIAVLERNDKSTYTVTVHKDESLSIPSGETALSLTDKTGAPGMFTCIPSTAYNLKVSASGFCTGDAGVTFALSGTQSGRHYELFRNGIPTAVATLTGAGNAQTFTAPINVPGSYTAKVLASGGYCETVMTGTHTVSENPLPTITLRSGTASQTVNLNTAIQDIVYTASDAAAISLRSGAFPTGVNGQASGSSFTIKGTPSVANRYGYSLTAAVGGCTSTSTAGTITVYPSTFTINSTGGPNTAYTTKTWSFGSGASAQTWSDRITKPICTNTATFSQDDLSATQYKILDGRYYYSWTCVQENGRSFCPSPWRVPTIYDISDLIDSYNISPAYVRDELFDSWGGGGYIAGSNVRDQKVGYYWSSTSSLNTNARLVMITPSADPYALRRYYGCQVRCVK
jgi:hypothetical protein